MVINKIHLDDEMKECIAKRTRSVRAFFSVDLACRILLPKKFTKGAGSSHAVRCPSHAVRPLVACFFIICFGWQLEHNNNNDDDEQCYQRQSSPP